MKKIFFNDTATTEIYTLSLHDALPIWLYLSAQLLLYAAEINVVLTRRLWPRSLLQPPLTEPDRRVLTALAETEERRPGETVEVRFAAADEPPPPGDDHPPPSGSPSRHQGPNRPDE